MSPRVTKSTAKEKLTDRIYSALRKIHSRPIRGEFKTWIYKCHLVSSLRFLLTVDHISLTPIKKIQTQATSFLKKWLNVPRCATIASLFHPELLKIPYLPHTQEKAKLRHLASVYLSPDTNVKLLAGIP